MDNNDQLPKPGTDIPLETLLTGITKTQRSKLRGTWLYSSQDLQACVGHEFGAVKLVLPASKLADVPDGSNPQRRAHDIIGNKFGEGIVTYVNRRSRTDPTPSGQVTFKITKLSQGGAEALARGYDVWPTMHEPRGFFVEPSHLIKSSQIIQKPAFDNSHIVIWHDLPAGYSDPGAIRKLFYDALPEIIEQKIEGHAERTKTTLNPNTGDECADLNEQSISMIEYWRQWLKFEKPYQRYFPPYKIHEDGKPYMSHIGRRPDYEGAEFEKNAIRVQFPVEFRKPIKDAIEEAAKQIGGAGWQIRFQKYVYPQPALSLLENFPITIRQKKDSFAALDPKRTALRVVVTPRRSTPDSESRAPPPLTPVQVMRHISQKMGVEPIAAESGQANIHLIAEGLHALVRVTKVIIDTPSTHKRMELENTKNQEFTVRISAWKQGHSLDKVEVGKEVFIVDGELATLPQKPAAERPQSCNAGDMITEMSQTGLKKVLEQGRANSKQDAVWLDKAEKIFALETEKRGDELDYKLAVLERERRIRHKAMEDLKIPEPNPDPDPAPTTPKASPVKAKPQHTVTPYLTIHLESHNRTTMITLNKIPEINLKGPTVMDLAMYLLDNLELDINGGIENELIEEWCERYGTDRAQMMMAVMIDGAQGEKPQIYPIPSSQARLKCLYDLYQLQTKHNRKITIKTKLTDKQESSHPGNQYVKVKPSTGWTGSPNKRAAEKQMDTPTTRPPQPAGLTTIDKATEPTTTPENPFDTAVRKLQELGQDMEAINTSSEDEYMAHMVELGTALQRVEAEGYSEENKTWLERLDMDGTRFLITENTLPPHLRIFDESEGMDTDL